MHSRHWKELMEKTGVYFEMTETFTLENMFAMELDKHADVLNEIVTAAIKEIAIEKVGLLPGRPTGEGAVAATQREHMLVPAALASRGAARARTRASATWERAQLHGVLARDAGISMTCLCCF